MNKCSVYICESKTEYEGQYEFMNAGMEVEIFNYHAPSEENVSIGDEVKYKEITIVDLRNRVFVFSPVFYNVGVTYALTQYEKYKTDFYFTTGKVDSVDSFSCNMKMSTLKMYHPLLMQCFNNPALQVSCGESEMNYKVIRNSDKKVVEIQNNNIKKIEFGGKCTYSRKNNGQLITIEAENYATIYLDEPITYKDLLMYIKEFDVLVNAYCPSGLHSYATYITTIEGKSFEVIHKLLALYLSISIPLIFREPISTERLRTSLPQLVSLISPILLSAVIFLMDESAILREPISTEKSAEEACILLTSISPILRSA